MRRFKSWRKRSRRYFPKRSRRRVKKGFKITLPVVLVAVAAWFLLKKKTV